MREGAQFSWRPLSYQACGPARGLQVDMPIGEEGNAFILEQCALHLGSAEGKTLRQRPSANTMR